MVIRLQKVWINLRNSLWTGHYAASNSPCATWEMARRSNECDGSFIKSCSPLNASLRQLTRCGRLNRRCLRRFRTPDDSSDKGADVFCWFEKGGQYLRCESRAATDGGFEFRVLQPDGTERVERFADAGELEKHQHAVIADVTEAGWHGPHGWNL